MSSGFLFLNREHHVLAIFYKGDNEDTCFYFIILFTWANGCIGKIWRCYTDRYHRRSLPLPLSLRHFSFPTCELLHCTDLYQKSCHVLITTKRLKKYTCGYVKYSNQNIRSKLHYLGLQRPALISCRQGPTKQWIN